MYSFAPELWKRYYDTHLLGEAAAGDVLDHTDELQEDSTTVKTLGETDQVLDRHADSATRRRRFSVFRRGVSYGQGAKEGKEAVKAGVKKLNFFNAATSPASFDLHILWL